MFLSHFLNYIFYLSNKHSIPGNFLPSKNSNDAPPPVEMCVILSANPAFSTAAPESPPPMIVVASNSAKVLAIAFLHYPDSR